MSKIGGSTGPRLPDPLEPDTTHPIAEKVGEALGLGLGIAVTEGLRLLPGWNKPVLGSDGKFVKSVPGAAREGDYAIRKRHEEVVGPAVLAKVKDLRAGLLHDFVAGFGIGATKAPGASYKLDAHLDRLLHPAAKKPGDKSS
jgi:hypothetical protein